MDNKTISILKKGYGTPPRPKGNYNYIAGVIDTLLSVGMLTENECDMCYDTLVYGWESNDRFEDKEFKEVKESRTKANKFIKMVEDEESKKRLTTVPLPYRTIKYKNKTTCSEECKWLDDKYCNFFRVEIHKHERCKECIDLSSNI